MSQPDHDGPSIVGLGEVLWDLLPTGRVLGGAPANVAFHASGLGARGAVASCVGDDELGREILARLDAAGVNRRAVAIDSAHPTGTVTVDLDADGKPSFTIHQDVAWDFLPASPGVLAVVGAADAVCFGSLAQRGEVARQTISQCLSATAASLRIFDINLRQHYYSGEIISACLDSANVLKLNDEELPVVAELLGLAHDPASAVAALVERFSLRLVALTCGERGSQLVTADETSSRPASQVEVVDSVGAGDAFTAVVALGMLAGLPLSAIHERAERVAGYVCTQAGATPALPDELRLID